MVPEEGEMDSCKVDCFVLRSVSFSPVTCCARARVSTDVDGNVTLQTACITLPVLVVAVIGDMTAILHVAGALMGIRYRDEILQH